MADEPPPLGPDDRRRTLGHQLPNVLVANRAGSVLTFAVLGAVVCSLGIVRACELEREQRIRELVVPGPRH